MKPILALATLALVALVFEEKARQAAGDARDAYDEAVKQATFARDAVSVQVKGNPLMAILTASGVGYSLAKLLPR